MNITSKYSKKIKSKQKTKQNNAITITTTYLRFENILLLVGTKFCNYAFINSLFNLLDNGVTNA